MPGEPEEQVLARGPKRWLLLVAGFVFTALAVVGAFLPVLPTTPFLLVAAACFFRASPTLYRLLLENRVFGPYIRQWREERTIPLEAKRKAYGLVVVTFGISIAVSDPTWLRLTLAALCIALLVFLHRLPTS